MRKMSPSLINRRRSSSNSSRKHITRQMASVIPSLLTQIQCLTPNYDSACPSTANNNRSFKSFTSVHPSECTGEGNTTMLLHWFEKMEIIFLHCECLDHKKTNFASSVFNQKALTWWNSVKDTQSAKTAIALP